MKTKQPYNVYTVNLVVSRVREARGDLHEWVSMLQEPADDGVTGLVVGYHFLLFWLQYQ